MGDELACCIFEVADWGWVGVVATERGVRGLVLPRNTREDTLFSLRALFPEAPLATGNPLLDETQRQVTAYLEGALTEFTIPVDLRGHTSFALSVWAASTRIKYGETRAYRWIAEQIGGSDGAGIYQAVGSALGANPVPLIIPCHRVVGADGSLHGYAGGLALKGRLLALESGQGTLAL